jgi:hypothetical protein
MAGMPTLHDDTAGYDAIKEAFELRSAFTDSRSDRFGGVHVAKCDLKWQLHRIFPSS